MFKNRPVMPRTATSGQRTVSDMTRSLEKAGYDTSKLQGHVLAAKAIGAEQRKRKRAERADESMDVDASDAGEWEDEAMDVDGEPSTSPKRARGNSGAVMARSKLPRSNRQTAGLKNAEVRLV